eukprot:2636605-Lingulodinium_polyedra.AAC.1
MRAPGSMSFTGTALLQAWTRASSRSIAAAPVDVRPAQGCDGYREPRPKPGVQGCRCVLGGALPGVGERADLVGQGLQDRHHLGPECARGVQGRRPDEFDTDCR